MNFFEHLNKEFAYTKEAFLYAINKLSDANSIVINIGISSLSYNTGFLNIRNFKNFIKDVSELINANTKRHIVIVVSDSLEKAKQQYLQPDNSGLSSALDALTQNNNTVGVDSLEKIKQQYLQPHDNLSTSSGLYSALVALAHNDIVNLFYDGFANYNLRVIGFSVSSVGADTTGELNKTLKTIESIVFSGSKTNDVKIRAVRELIKNKKSIAQTSSFNVMTKKTAETLKGLFRNFPGTVPIIMEDVSQKDNRFEEDDGFASKIAIAINADAIVSVSKKGMLYTVDPVKNDNALPFYCFDTSRKVPFNDVRKAELAKKLNAAERVNAHNKSIPMILTSYDNPYTICNIFDKKVINGICNNGNYPKFTIFINSKDVSIPIENRHVSGAIVIDDNAEKALVKDKKSLLSVGIVEVQDDFESKSVVLILNRNSEEVGRGVVNFSSSEIKQKMEEKHSAEVITRTKMRITQSVENESETV